MAPAFLLYETEQKQDFRDPSTRAMGKARRLSRNYSSTFIADYEQAIERVGESEGLADSSISKRKCISLNTDRCEVFNVPTQVISVSKMSASERKEVELKLRAQLDQIQMFQKKIESEAANGVAVSSTADGNVSSKKAPLSAGNVHPPKRGHGGRFERTARPPSSPATMKHCSQLLNRLLQHPYAWVFKEPVDAVKLNIPDYYTIIKQPMDFGTIKSKLAKGSYAVPMDFAADMRLTFSNAKTYNPPGNDVHSMADALSVKFESKWKFIEKKIHAVDASKISREAKASNPFAQSKKRKAASLNPVADAPTSLDSTKKKMTAAEKHKLSGRLESYISVLPDPVIEFLKKNSGHQMDAADDEIEIDIDALGDETLFELKRLLDEFLPEDGAKEDVNVQHREMEIMNESGLSNSSMQPIKGSEPLGDEEIDIVGHDQDTLQQIKSKCSSSSNSSSDSESSSDSDSGSSSESELHAAKILTPMDGVKGTVTASEAAFEQEKSDVMNPADGCTGSGGGLSGNTEQVSSSHQPKEGEEGENAPSERQVSPGKLYRAALLRSRFADTILKAREKALLDKAERSDPEKRQREREELERQQREERARLQAEAKAAEEARRQAEAEAAAEAAAEAKRKRELEREAARQALLKIEKTVEIDENSQSLMDLEMLSSAPAIDLPVFVDEVVSDASPDGSAAGCFVKLGGSNPLEQLGLYMKADDDEEDEPDSAVATTATAATITTEDVEEGEID